LEENGGLKLVGKRGFAKSTPEQEKMFDENYVAMHPNPGRLIYQPDRVFYTLPHPVRPANPANPANPYPRLADPTGLRRVYSFNQFNNSFYFHQNQFGSLKDLQPGESSQHRGAIVLVRFCCATLAQSSNMPPLKPVSSLHT
jgi:hypothetical protein